MAEYQKIGGVWKPVTPFVKVGGTWRSCTKHVKVGGVWKSMGGSAPWTLADLGTDRLLDLDASIAASITGTSPITAIADQSSYGNNSTTQFPQASYNAATKAFRNGIVNINHAAIGSEWNAFIVATKLNPSTDYRSILYYGPGEVHILTSTGTNTLGSYNSASAFGSSGLSWAQNELRLVRCQRLSTGNSLSLGGGSLSSTGRIVGADPTFFGAWTGNSQQWGDIHQVVILPATATTDQIQRTEGLLSHKWDAELGVTTLVTALPSGHPYKSAPP